MLADLGNMMVSINKTTEEYVLIINSLQNGKEFKRGKRQLLVPRIEALALPDVIERATSIAHAI